MLIVARDQEDYYDLLRHGYRDSEEITVLLDRRQADRRCRVQPVAGERRYRDRRISPSIAHDLRCQKYVLAYPTGDGGLAPPSTSPRWCRRVLRHLRDLYAGLRGTTTDRQPPTMHRLGGPTMPHGLAGPERARTLRWMDESPAVLDAVYRMVDEYDQAREAVRAAQAERERLRQECDALRAQASQLRAELVRLQQDRTELAHWFAVMVAEAAARFPSEPPPA